MKLYTILIAKGYTISLKSNYKKAVELADEKIKLLNRILTRSFKK
jgi:hypothetical protein